jgi:hypothetical protein
MPSKSVAKLLSLVLTVYTVMLLVGFFILHQILLAILIATALLLTGAVVYFARKIMGGSNGNRESQSL